MFQLNWLQTHIPGIVERKNVETLVVVLLPSLVGRIKTYEHLIRTGLFEINQTPFKAEDDEAKRGTCL